MARSLTVKHDEKPATSSLLNVFLLVAFACLVLASVAGASTADSPEPVAATPVTSTDR